MRKGSRILACVLSVMFLLGISSSALAARDIRDFYFSMTNSNESDQTGVFNTYDKRWVTKATKDIDAAIRCDTYSNSTYNYKSTLNYTDAIRATEFVWLNTNKRKTPEYLSGYGAKGDTYELWARRDDRETSSSSTARGTWSPDHK